MYIEHFGEISNFHLGKGFIAQDAGIGAQQIDASPFAGRTRHHGFDLLEIGNIGAIGHRHATGFANFLDDVFRRGQRTAAAVAGAAEIVDDDLRAAAGQPQRMRAPKTIARAGDDSDASVKPDCHDCSSQPLSKIDQADPVGHKRGFFLALDFHAHIGARLQFCGFSQFRFRQRKAAADT